VGSLAAKTGEGWGRSGAAQSCVADRARVHDLAGEGRFAASAI
jgi:hypothetical protein